MKGIIGKKVGMTQIFDENGQVIPVTVIQAGPCYVTQVRTEEKDGYTAVQLGFEELPPKRNGRSRLNKPKQGHLKRNSLELPDLRVLREFRVKEIDVEEGQKSDKRTCSPRATASMWSVPRRGVGLPVRSSATISTVSPRRTVQSDRDARAGFDRLDHHAGPRAARVRAWPAIWAATVSPFKISKSSWSMRRRICSLCVGRFRARRAASS